MSEPHELGQDQGLRQDDPARSTPAEEAWLRLDPRKLLLDPVKALGQMLVPIIAVLVGVSSADSPGLFLVLGPVALVGVLLLGALPWLTTHYRLTPTQFQLRKGWLNRTTSTAPLDRVRSVDLEASLLHRVLGLRKVQIGTGRDEERIELDALDAARADELRRLLLDRRTRAADAAMPGADDLTVRPGHDGTASPVDVPAGPHPSTYPEAAPEQVLARIDWTWLRFAPLSLGRLVVVAGSLGVLSQFLDDVPILDGDDVQAAWEWVTSLALVVLVVGLAVAVVVGWLVISVVGYVVQWWGLRLSRSDDSLHLTSGLLTTRSISVDEKRVRGVELKEPWLLQLAGGAELATLATGVGSGGQTRILPPCPLSVTRTVAGDVLDTPEPIQADLQQHGPAARRRAHVRQQWDSVAVLVAAVTLTVIDPPGFLDRIPVWLPWLAFALLVPLGVWLAESSYARLGHALTPEHFVAGSGTLARVRTVLETDGIIGWVIRQNFFQRRIGLADLVATTAAGNEQVLLSDVPLERAVELADAATPGTLTPFLQQP